MAELQAGFWPSNGVWSDFEKSLILCESAPMPYSWIVRDCRVSIEQGANFLSALGLICYTEICGRLVAREKGLRPIEKDNQKAFEYFFKEYMQCGSVLLKIPLLYPKVRNGLVHDYFDNHMKEAVEVTLGASPGDGESFGVVQPSSNQIVICLMAYYRCFVFGIEKRMLEKGARPK